MSGIGLGIFAAFLISIKNADFSSSFYLETSIPIFAGSCSIIWNVFALAAVRYVRPLAQSVGDLFVLVMLAVLVPVGISLDQGVYNIGNWSDIENQWLNRVISGGVFLVFSAILQAFLAFINFWQHRRLKQEVMRKKKGKGRADSESVSTDYSQTMPAPSLPSLAAIRPKQTKEDKDLLKNLRKNLSRITSQEPSKDGSKLVQIPVADVGPRFHSIVRFA